MATLKSPRNTRKKTVWTRSYLRRLNFAGTNLSGSYSPRSKHQLQRFLRDSAYWVVSEQGSTRDQNFLLPEFIKNERPPVYIKYGKNTLDYARTHPFILSTDLRDPKIRSRLTFWSNSPSRNSR